MELRGQDREIGGRPIGYNTTVLNNPTHNLDHQHHQLHLHQQRKHVPDSIPNPDPDPAPAPTAALVSNSKSLSPTPQPLALAANSAASVRYKECLKNHAAAMGGNVLDGCGEFMPGGEEGTLESMKCAACDCHRNFHRKEVDGEAQIQSLGPNSSYLRNRTTTQLPPPPLPPPHHRHRYSHNYSPTGPVMMAFGGGSRAPAESTSEDLNMFHSNAGPQAVVRAVQPPFSPLKKRFRTKFSQEQKDRMQEFGERLGWRIQKQDEKEVEQFCGQVGVKRQVFKVWMHNIKQAMKKKQS